MCADPTTARRGACPGTPCGTYLCYLCWTPWPDQPNGNGGRHAGAHAMPSNGFSSFAWLRGIPWTWERPKSITTHVGVAMSALAVALTSSMLSKRTPPCMKPA